MLNAGLFSSKTCEWATPISFFNELNNEFNFEIDVCANEMNKKCDRYFSKEEDGLKQNWGGVFYTLV